MGRDAEARAASRAEERIGPEALRVHAVGHHVDSVSGAAPSAIARRRRSALHAVTAPARLKTLAAARRAGHNVSAT